jgi:hypothetical protein
MVDWVSLVLNELWILGLAIILAALSHADWLACTRRTQLRTLLAAPGFQLWLSVGLVLASLGMALLGPRWWERVLWALFCAMNTWRLCVAWRECRTKGG